MKPLLLAPVAVCCLIAFGSGAAAAQSGEPAKGTVERIKIHGKSLEGNLEGDSPDRDVSIYLPPSYKTNPKRRFPVLYFLHGFTDDDARWFGLQKHWIDLPKVLDRALAGGKNREVIVVMPNAFTVYQGSMYSKSATTGNWEEYVASEVVAYIDSHYRTLPRVASRALAGHSMGGYGAMRIGMRRPDVFSTVYLLSPCCMAPNLGNSPNGAQMLKRAEAIQKLEDVEKADFLTKAMLASGAAWSPNPKNPPLYLDLPYRKGEFQPMVAAKWAANAPLAMVDQYISNIQRLRAIGFDAGTKDAGIARTVKTLHDVLDSYGIEHAFEIYEGTHTDGVATRIEMNVIPLLSKTLEFERVK